MRALPFNNFTLLRSMFNFWENIARYPRFFISAVVGLFLILVSPFQKLLRTNLGKLLFILIVSTILTLVFLTFNAMLNM
jgi:hypothetical protein